MVKKKLKDFLDGELSVVKTIKVVAKDRDEYRSLMMLTLGKDGSIIINSGAYFGEGNWSWGFFDIPPGRKGKVNVPIVKSSLQKKVDGFGPKITYHLSGWMTTKLEGHINDKKVPRVKATPLEEVNGHFFTVQAKGFDSFKTANVKKKKYLHLPVSKGKELSSVKIVGYLGTLEQLVGDATAETQDFNNVHTIVEKRDGYITECHFFRIDFDSGEQRWLELQFWPDFPYNVSNPNPSFSILTGWKIEEISDKTKVARSLGLMAGK